MTVAANETIAQSFACGALTVNFNFTIPCYSSSDLKIYTKLIASPYTETLKTITTHYTVALTAAVAGTDFHPGGTVAFLVAPGTSYTVFICRKLIQTQETAQGAITPISLVSALDKLARQVQDLQYRLNRCMALKDTDAADDMIIPLVRASLTAKYDASGDPSAS